MELGVTRHFQINQFNIAQELTSVQNHEAGGGCSKDVRRSIAESTWGLGLERHSIETWRSSWPDAKGTYRKIVQNPKNRAVNCSQLFALALKHRDLNTSQWTNGSNCQVCWPFESCAYVFRSRLMLAWRNDDAQLFGHIYIYINDLSKCIRKIQRVLLVLFVKEDLLHNLLSFTSRAVSTATSRTFLWSTPRQKIANPNSYPKFQRVDESWQPSFGPKKRQSLDPKKTHGQPLGHVDPQALGARSLILIKCSCTPLPLQKRFPVLGFSPLKGLLEGKLYRQPREPMVVIVLIYIYIYRYTHTLHYITLHYTTLHYITLYYITYIHSYIHIHIHTYTHTHIHTQTYIHT